MITNTSCTLCFSLELTTTTSAKNIFKHRAKCSLGCRNGTVGVLYHTVPPATDSRRSLTEKKLCQKPISWQRMSACLLHMTGMEHRAKHTGDSDIITVYTAARLARQPYINEVVCQLSSNRPALTCERRRESNTGQYTRCRTPCGRHADRHRP